jgi:hypothetical protein
MARAKLKTGTSALANFLNPNLLCRKLLINTRLQPGAHGVRGEKNRLNGFS